MKALPLSQTSLRIQNRGFFGWDIHERAANRKANGEDIILLTLGDPDLDTPQHICEGLVNALRKHRTHYANPHGEYSLRKTLAALESKNTGKDLQPNQFNVFHGASSALYSTLRCVANPGEKVVLIEPHYIGYIPILDAAGLKPNVVSTETPEFAISSAAIEAALDDETVAVLLNTPVNPTGHVVDAAEMRRIYEICRDRGVWLICDEVYSLLYFDRPHTSMLKVADDLDNVIVIDSLSKSHAMTGWRVGWSVSNPDFAQILTKFASASFFACNQFVQDAAEDALNSSSAIIERTRQEFRKRRDYTIERISRIEQLKAVTPSSGIFVMVDVGEDGYEFASRMLEAIGISVAPGFACGEVTKNFVRVSYGMDMHELQRAWDRIESWLANPSLNTVKSEQHTPLSDTALSI